MSDANLRLNSGRCSALASREAAEAPPYSYPGGAASSEDIELAGNDSPAPLQYYQGINDVSSLWSESQLQDSYPTYQPSLSYTLHDTTLTGSMDPHVGGQLFESPIVSDEDLQCSHNSVAHGKSWEDLSIWPDSHNTLKTTDTVNFEDSFSEPRLQPDLNDHAVALNRSEITALDFIFASVHAGLMKLKQTTPKSLPRYNHRLRMQKYAQIIKTRLIPIASRIEQVLADVPVHEKGQAEMKLCLFIANQYWPLPATPTTHIDIFRIYRNTQFRQVPRLQLDVEAERNSRWQEEVQEMQPTRGSFRAAAVRHVNRLESSTNYDQDKEAAAEQRSGVIDLEEARFVR